MTRPMSTDQAESIALQALAFLASDSELLPRFLALTGIDPGEIRKAAAEPGFLAGVLAFFMAHEPSLLKLAEVVGLKPEDLDAAAHALPAGDDRYEQST